MEATAFLQSVHHRLASVWDLKGFLFLIVTNNFVN